MREISLGMGETYVPDIDDYIQVMHVYERARPVIHGKISVGFQYIGHIQFAYWTLRTTGTIAERFCLNKSSKEIDEHVRTTFKCNPQYDNNEDDILSHFEFEQEQEQEDFVSAPPPSPFDSLVYTPVVEDGMLNDSFDNHSLRGDDPLNDSLMKSLVEDDDPLDDSFDNHSLVEDDGSLNDSFDNHSLVENDEPLNDSFDNHSLRGDSIIECNKTPATNNDFAFEAELMNQLKFYNENVAGIISLLRQKRKLE